MIEKDAVHGFTYSLFAAEREWEIRHTAADLTGTKSLLHSNKTALGIQHTALHSDVLQNIQWNFDLTVF